MRYLRWFTAFCSPILLCAPGAAQGPRTHELPLRTLTTAHEAHDISLDQAARAFPVHLRGVVTYYDPNVDPRHAALFVHDSTGSIFIGLPSRPILPLPAGTLVEVTGVTGNGDFAPVILRPTVKVVGKSLLPQNPSRPTMAELLSGSRDGQWIEIEGMVQSVSLDPFDVTLGLATVGGPITAVAPREQGVDYDSLVDAMVQVRGNAVPVFDRNRQMVGARVLFPSVHQLKVVQPAPFDPYAIPAVPVSGLLRFSPGVILRHRALIQGRVTLHWPGRMLCIQEEADGLCMQSPKLDQVRTGQMVDVVGFPAISDFKPTLKNASFRVTGGTMTSTAATVTVQEAFRGEHDGELVQIDGELIGQDRAAGDLTLILRSGDFLFSAILPKDFGGGGSLPWKDGSVVRITGVCSVQMDPKTTGQGSGSVRTGSLDILLRSLDDVAVLRAPSLWTPRNAVAVLSVAGLSALASLAWILVLRRRVEQQTQAIRRSEERLRHLSQHDVLTGLPNRFLLNDRLDMALKRTDRFESALGLLMVDLDGFKEVNDSLGHHAGDQVLCEVAKRISCNVRQTDTVARLGGDEFIVLLPDLRQASEAETIAAKIVAAIVIPVDVGVSTVTVSASVGVCVAPEQGVDAEKLLQCVDAAMYRAKACGKNGYHVYQAETENSPARSG